MCPNQLRPYADKSDEQLSALAERVAQHLDALAMEQAMIHEEQRLRAPRQILLAEEDDLPRAQRIPLEYRRPGMRWNRRLSSDQAYARSARGYALRTAGIISGIILALGGIALAFACFT